MAAASEPLLPALPCELLMQEETSRLCPDGKSQQKTPYCCCFLSPLKCV